MCHGMKGITVIHYKSKFGCCMSSVNGVAFVESVLCSRHSGCDFSMYEYSLCFYNCQ